MGSVKVNIGTAASPLWVRLGSVGTTLCTSTTRPTSPFTGQQIYETDTGLTWVYTGTVWQFQDCTTMQGTVNSGVLTASAAKGVAVTFATPFPINSPQVTVIGVSNATGLGSTPIVSTSGVSRTGFTMNFYRTNTTVFDATWIATNSPLFTTT